MISIAFLQAVGSDDRQEARSLARIRTACRLLPLRVCRTDRISRC
jgi:hypothetical protein